MLPKIKVPMFSVTIPSSQKKIMMKSLTTKEYKLLLIAKENKNPEQEFITIRQIINNAIVDKIDIDTLPLYDIEHLYVKLMIASTAEKSLKLAYRCKKDIIVKDETNNTETKEVCNEVNRISADLSTAEVKLNTNTECQITVNSDDDQQLTLVFTYPTLKAYINTNVKNKIDITGACLTKIVHGDSVLVLGRDYTEQEANELIDDLTEEQLKSVLQFYKNVPQLELKHTFVCKKCKNTHEIHLKGLRDFFT